MFLLANSAFSQPLSLSSKLDRGTAQNSSPNVPPCQKFADISLIYTEIMQLQVLHRLTGIHQ